MSSTTRITKVITIVGGELHQRFYHHNEEDLCVVGNELLIEQGKPGERGWRRVTFPLCNVERYETEVK